MRSGRCIICGKSSRYICRNIFRLKSSYSETPINIIIERISQSIVNISEESDETISCQECILKLEEYDVAYTKARDLEQEILNSLIKSGVEPEHQPVNISKFTFRKVLVEGLPKSTKGRYVCTKEDFFTLKTEPEHEINEEFHEQVLETDCSEGNTQTYYEDAPIDSSSETVAPSNDYEDQSSPVKKSSTQWNECLACGQAFSTKRKLDFHMKTHENKPKCGLCGKTFKSEILLEIHLQTHQGKSELECSDCSKFFSSKGALIKHRRIHGSDFVYQCEHCGKQFIHDSSMRMHKLIHEDIREKVCPVCNRAFRSTQHLKRHLRTHTGEKPYYCSKCGKTFAQKYNMMTHYSKVHRLPVRKRKFECSKCPEVFSMRSQLIEHIKAMHEPEDSSTTIVQIASEEDGNYQEYIYAPVYYEETINYVQ